MTGKNKPNLLELFRKLLVNCTMGSNGCAYHIKKLNTYSMARGHQSTDLHCRCNI